MLKNHILNIDEKDIDKEIYRIVPIQRLFEIFDIKKLTLMKPSMWDDPFENLLLKSAAGKKKNFVTIREAIYGQCWTMHRETDAMWRIYSSDKQGVKVKTTIRKLIESLIAHNQNERKDTCFIGKVEYVAQSKIVSKLKAMNIHANIKKPNLTIAESILYKRIEFKHEKEVRLIFTGDGDDNYQYNINPHDLFDEVIFDPRINEYLFEAYRDLLKNMGYNKSIRQSVLYRVPKNLYDD